VAGDDFKGDGDDGAAKAAAWVRAWLWNSMVLNK